MNDEKQQGSLFDDANPVPRPPHVHREAFLFGMLAPWLLGDKKPNTMQREELARLSRRFLADCEMVVKLHRTSP
jgi:hypothetical protein